MQEVKIGSNARTNVVDTRIVELKFTLRKTVILLDFIYIPHDLEAYIAITVELGTRTNASRCVVPYSFSSSQT